MANVNVAGEDITGMVVVGTRGAKATGTITYGSAREAGRDRGDPRDRDRPWTSTATRCRCSAART